MQVCQFATGLSPLRCFRKFYLVMVWRSGPIRIGLYLSRRGRSLRAEEIRCPAMAERFVELFPNNLYSAVGVNPKIVLTIPQNIRPKMKLMNSLVEKGEWLSFKDTMPEIQLKTVYDFGRKKIVLDVVEAAGKNETAGRTIGILFQANVHRDLLESRQDMRTQEILSTLSSWEQDLSDFMALVGMFHYRRLVS